MCESIASRAPGCFIFIHAVKFGRSFRFPVGRIIPNVEPITRKGASVLWETRGIFVRGIHATPGVTLVPEETTLPTPGSDFSARRLKYPRAGERHRFFI